MNETTKKSTNQKISDFLTRQKKVLFTVLTIVVCVIIVFGIYSTINNKKNNEIVNSTTKLDRLYNDLLRSEGDENEFIEYANTIITDYGNSRAELTAYSRMAGYYFEQKDFDKALEYYTLAYTNFPNDIATSVYMFNAAMANEELGALDDAILVLESAVNTFKNPDIDAPDFSSDIPEVLFNLARLYETVGNEEKAIENYEVLVAEYQSYNLASLAKTRLIQIK